MTVTYDIEKDRAAANAGLEMIQYEYNEAVSTGQNLSDIRARYLEAVKEGLDEFI